MSTYFPAPVTRKRAARAPHLSGILLACALLPAALPALAIRGGQEDGNRHPNVGAIVLKVTDETDGSLVDLVTQGGGVLIAPRVMTAAGHTAYEHQPGPEGLGWLEENFPGLDFELLVTFDPVVSPESRFFQAVAKPHPRFDYYSPDFPPAPLWEYGVLVLSEAPAGVRPARLASPLLLNALAAPQGATPLTFTTVGYGRDCTAENPGANPASRGIRRFAQHQALFTPDRRSQWLFTDATASAACFNDSGSPRFVHIFGRETDIVAATVIGGEPGVDISSRLDHFDAWLFYLREIIAAWR